MNVQCNVIITNKEIHNQSKIEMINIIYNIYLRLEKETERINTELGKSENERRNLEAEIKTLNDQMKSLKSELQDVKDAKEKLETENKR